jgi:hypothetical protein
MGHELPICGRDAMSASPPIALQNSKMWVRKNSAIFPSKWIFGDTMPCNELTKEAGWKSDCLCAPYMVFERTRQRPWNTLHTPQKRVLQHNPLDSDPIAASHYMTLRANNDGFALRKI